MFSQPSPLVDRSFLLKSQATKERAIEGVRGGESPPPVIMMDTTAKETGTCEGSDVGATERVPVSVAPRVFMFAESKAAKPPTWMFI